MAVSFLKSVLLALSATASLGAFAANDAAALTLSTGLTAVAPSAHAGVPSEGLSFSAPQVLELHDPLPRVPTLDLTRDANDIWDRIRRGFGMPDLDTQLVIEQQLFYLNRPGFLKKVFERGGRYLYYIVDELERRGMPTELALLPMVESSYNPMAYSRAHASGLWQFIPSTGRNYKLTQDKFVDERRDVIASTNAALDYLQNIYEMHGDWHLALASYNWGEGAVGRAVQRNLADGQSGEYSQLRMPDETRNYVPKLQALKNIVSQPELFRFELPYVSNSRHFVTVDTPTSIDIATAAQLAEMPLEEFVALNPSYNRPAIAPEGAALVIPVDREEAFRLKLEEHQKTGARWRTHELARGETLASIARESGVPLNQLLDINGLTSRSRVSPGHMLLIPHGVDPAAALAAARSVPQPAKPAKTQKTSAKGKKSAGKKSTGKSSAKAKSDSRKAATKSRTPARTTTKTATKTATKTR